ncbi:MAG: hypothetical protein WHU10_01750 [Fimbriimonadales bacterium]
MLHLVPALLILWLQGTMADRPVPPSAVRAVLAGLPGRTAPAERLKAIEAWLGDQATEEVLRHLGAWLELCPASDDAEVSIESGAPGRSPVAHDERAPSGWLPGVARFRDGPVR